MKMIQYTTYKFLVFMLIIKLNKFIHVHTLTIFFLSYILLKIITEN